MREILAVMAGGALGAALRYGVVRLGDGSPWATLAINVAGCFAMGLLAGVVAARLSEVPTTVLLFAGVDVLGGFTTFSAFGLDAVRLAQGGELALATGYVVASVLGSIAAVAAGMAIVRGLA